MEITLLRQQETSSNRLRIVAQALLLLAIFVSHTGCANPVDDPRWKFARVPAGPLPEAVQPYTIEDANQLADSPYALHMVVHAPNIDMSSWPRFVKTSRNARSMSKQSLTPGHSWVVLESPKGYLFRGHTGNFGITEWDMATEIFHREKQGDPNPIAICHEFRHESNSHAYPGSYRASFALRVPITIDQYERAQRKLKLYNYSRFCLASNQCTDLVAMVAANVGLALPYRVHLTLPPQLTVFGNTYRVWTDPAYETLEMGNPDELHNALKALHEQGIGTDSSKLINHILNTVPYEDEYWYPLVSREIVE